jgi:hypothetical protein
MRQDDRIYRIRHPNRRLGFSFLHPAHPVHPVKFFPKNWNDRKGTQRGEPPPKLSWKCPE